MLIGRKFEVQFLACYILFAFWFVVVALLTSWHGPNAHRPYEGKCLSDSVTLRPFLLLRLIWYMDGI